MKSCKDHKVADLCQTIYSSPEIFSMTQSILSQRTQRYHHCIDVGDHFLFLAFVVIYGVVHPIKGQK